MAFELLKLKATLGLDSKEYEEGLKNAEDTANKSSIGSKLGTVAKVGAAAIGAAATATGVLVKKSLDGYAQYEQMLGGVKKLYGNMGQSVEEYAQAQGKSVAEVQGEWQKLEDAQNLVLKNAQEAYKTSGMSANQYMETATSFSAALINSLEGDTVKAAEQTDVAMRAISDNFNTFGGDITMIQGAFQGFAKQNYTMLDNLKLGYGGTKSEMERLIADANEWAKANGKAADLTIDSFSDVVTAIDYIQQKQHIAGTTAREGTTTIEGSLMGLKAAWENLVTGFSDPDADLGQLIDNVVDTAGSALENLIPTIERALKGVADFIGKAGPMIAEKLPELIDTILPSLLEAATGLVDALAQSLPEMAMSIIETLVQALTTSLPKLTETAVQAIAEFARGIGEAAPTLIPQVVELVLTIVDALLDNIDLLIDAALQLALGIAIGLIEAIPQILDKIPIIISNIIAALIAAIPRVLAAAIQLFNAIVVGLVRTIPRLVAAIPALIAALAGGITKGIVKITKVGGDLVRGLWKGIKERWTRLVNDAKNLASNLVSALKSIFGISSPSKVFAEIGKQLDAGLAVGIKESIPMVSEAMEDLDSQIVVPEVDTSVAGFNTSPSTTTETETMWDVLKTPISTLNNIPIGSTNNTPKDITVILQLDRMQLAKTVFRLNNEESQRVGVNLAGGFA